MSRLLISAAHKSSGKTTISVGLCSALTQRGLMVQAFKKGPDYIDPMWLSQASGRACFNLDPYLMSHAQITSGFAAHSKQADISIVEGNKGLYDGLALDGSNSNAALAKLLNLPVVLVLDARGMTRGIAPLILGYQAFDPAIHIAGVILNNVGGTRHESKLRAVIEHYTDVEVLGAIGYDTQLAVTERHLGLMPNHEIDNAAQRIKAMGSLIATGVNLDCLLAVANLNVKPLPADVARIVSDKPVTQSRSMERQNKKDLRIGIAQDKAFGFYYQDDLLAFENAGAELVSFDTLIDKSLPKVDGVFIGGGFPEMFMPELEANQTMRSQIKQAIEEGMPVYAECGGLMYLARSIRWNDKCFDMVGALPADVHMHNKPIGRGYVELETTANMPWASQGADAVANVTVKGHEFHYSSLENMAPEMRYAYRVKRGHGADGEHDGLLVKNVLASYSHLHQNASSQWVTQFVDFVREIKKGRMQ